MNTTGYDRMAASTVHLITLALAAIILINNSLLQIPLVGVIALFALAPMLYKSGQISRHNTRSNPLNLPAIARLYAIAWIIYIFYAIYYIEKIGLI